jgi:regulatory protein
MQSRPVPEDDPQAALQKAFRYLGIRARTRHELKNYLEGKEYTPEVVEQVLARLTQLKLIDDAAFARDLIAEKLRRKPLGPRAARFELMKHGVDEATAETAVETQFAGLDEKELARRIVAKRRPSGGGPLDEKEKRRLAAFLGRRGISTGTIYALLKEGPHDSE